MNRTKSDEEVFSELAMLGFRDEGPDVHAMNLCVVSYAFGGRNGEVDSPLAIAVGKYSTDYLLTPVHGRIMDEIYHRAKDHQVIRAVPVLIMYSLESTEADPYRVRVLDIEFLNTKKTQSLTDEAVRRFADPNDNRGMRGRWLNSTWILEALP